MSKPQRFWAVVNKTDGLPALDYEYRLYVFSKKIEAIHHVQADEKVVAVKVVAGKN